MTPGELPGLTGCSPGSISPSKIPDLYSSFRTAGSQPFSIRAEGQIRNSTIVPIDEKTKTAIPWIQQVNPSIPRTCCKKLPVGTVDDSCDPPAPVNRGKKNAAGMSVQDAHRSTAGSYGKLRTIRTVGQGGDAMIVASQLQELFAFHEIPDHNGPVNPAARQPLSIRTENNAPDSLAMTGKRLSLNTRNSIPELYRAIVARTCDKKPIRAEHGIVDPPPVTAEAKPLGPGSQVPQHNDTIPSRARHQGITHAAGDAVNRLSIAKVRNSIEAHPRFPDPDASAGTDHQPAIVAERN